jgi:AAA15 family ATPase/GTPase
MKIKSIQIKNLYSYKDASFSFGNYNVIVGRNASGKTNLIRILKLLTKPSAPSTGPPSLSLTGISNELARALRKDT